MTELPLWKGDGGCRPAGKSGLAEAEASGLLCMGRLLFEVSKRQDGIKPYWRNGSF